MKSITLRIAVLGMLIALGWYQWAVVYPHTQQAFRCADCNIILIALDPLRADGLGVLGNPRPATPFIDSLSRRGFLFRNAFAPAPWTLPSAMSLLTGTYPSTHKIVNKVLVGKTEQEGLIPAHLATVSPQIVTLAGALKAQGYTTAAFMGGGPFATGFGFDIGFDSYITDDGFHGLDTAAPNALNFISSHKNERLFIFLHGFDVHGQYIPPEGYDKRFVDRSYQGPITGAKEEEKALREEGMTQGNVFLTPADVATLRALYDEKLARADLRLANFFASYQALGLAEKTIIIFTSNHGEEFYEHGRIDHGMTLYDELLHVPLLIVVPGISKGKIIDDQVRTIDIMPTIFSLVGITPAASLASQLEGVSLAPLMKGARLALDVFAETSYRYATSLKSLRTNDGWKLIYDEETKVTKLYNMHHDPKEQQNLAGQGNPKEKDLFNRLMYQTLTKYKAL